MPTFQGNFYWSEPVFGGGTYVPFDGHSSGFIDDNQFHGDEGTLTDDDNIIQDNDEAISTIDVSGLGSFPILEAFTATLTVSGNAYTVWVASVELSFISAKHLVVGQVGGAPIPELEPGVANGVFSNVQDISSTGVTATCFLPGSLICTPNGEVAVEELAQDAQVVTAHGETLRIKWLGRQNVFARFGPAERLLPVRFAAGSLGAGVPHSDLMVTADHGMLVDGVICHAGALVNGTTITRVPLSELGDSYTVYHIETERHEIILANGAPAETFIDNVSRRAFDNYAEFEALYGDVPEMEELPLPRAMSARQVPMRIAHAIAGRMSA